MAFNPSSMTTEAWKKQALKSFNARGGRKISAAEKQQKIAAVLKQARSGNAWARKAAIDKIAAAQAGNIVIRLAYEGILRRTMVEVFKTQGAEHQIDIMDDWGAAYVLNGHGGEVKIELIEARRMIPDYYRIAAHWAVKEEDVILSSANPLEYAEQQTYERIMEQEDTQLLTLIEAGLQSWTADHTGPGTDDEATRNPNTITEASPNFTLDTFLEASSRISSQRLEGARLLMNPADVYNIYKWDVTVVGLKFKEDYIAGNKIVNFGDYEIVQSVMIPRGTVYMLPEPRYVGEFIVAEGLHDRDDTTRVASFEYSKVYSELVSMVLVNRNGLTKITKA